MNFKQRVSILLMVVALSLITIGNACAFINSYHNDINKKTTIIERVSNDYASFNNQSNALTIAVEEFNNSLDKYFITMTSTNPETLASLENMTKTLAELVPLAESLKSECVTNIGIDSVTDQKCSIFNQNYITIKDTYVKIIDSYNKVVSEYNNWAIDNEQILLEEYLSTYYEQFK